MNWATLYALLSKKIEESEGIHNSVVETLPAVGEENTLYFVPRTNEEDNNIFDEYLWINNEYEKIGSTEIDLSGYLKEEDVATVALTGDYDDLTNKPDISEFLTEDEADERYMSYDILDPETVTGNPITFDSLEGGKAKSCEVSFGPVQAGTGDPYPAGGGKNKLENGVQSKSFSTFTVTRNEDESLTINGTSDNATVLIGNISTGLYGAGTAQNDGKKHIPNGNYIISTGFSQSSGIQLQVYGTNDSSGTADLHAIGSTWTAGNLTIDSTYSYNYVRIYLNAGTYNNVTLYPMIRLSTESDPTYAPYSNIRPISGWTEVSVKRTGKNLAKPYVKASSIVSYDENGNVTVNGTVSGTLYVPTTSQAISDGILFTLKAGTYIPSLSNPYPNNDIFVNVVAKDNTNLSQGSSFTITEDTEVYARVVVKPGTYNNWTSGIQLELGSTATAYEPYNGQTHTATLGSTYYGGKLDMVSGKLIVEWVAVDMGSIDYTVSESGKFRYMPSDGIISGGVGNPANDFMCSIYTNQTNVVISSVNVANLNVAKTSSPTYSSYYFRDDNYSTKEAFKTAMSGQTFCYKLATPLEITLTEEEIELLKGQNVLWSDSNGNITLTAEQLELVKVIANPTGQATGTLEKIQIDEEIYEIPSELPAVSSTDEGKVLTVNSSGEWEAADIPAQVEANPSETATTDLTKLEVGGSVYGIPAAPTIVANPSGAATDILDKLQVGSTVYATPKQLDYSTAEQKIGVKWIDGRDIYQKTIKIDNFGSATVTNVAHNINNLGYVIDISGSMVASNSSIYDQVGLFNGNGDGIRIQVNSTDILIKSMDDWSDRTGYITIKYVKNLYPVSDPWPTGTGYGIGNFEWDDQMTSDIAADAHSWDSRYFTDNDPWWIKYISTNLDGSINVKAQHAWLDENPETANHFIFNKYYEPFYITTDTYVSYGGYAYASYTVAKDGTITRTGTGYERSDIEPKLYIRNTDGYLIQIDNEWFFKMYQEIPGYLIWANWNKLSNWLIESGNHQHIKEPLWKEN